MKVLFRNLLIVIALFCTTVNQAQDMGVYSDHTMIPVPAGPTPTLGSLNFITGCNAFKINDGKVWVKIDLGENYELGSNSAGEIFDITVDLGLTMVTAGIQPTINFQVKLNNNKPEGMVYIDLRQYIDEANTTTGLSYLVDAITGVSASVNSATDTLNNINLNDELKISLHYEIDYAMQVDNNTVVLREADLLPSTKVIHFEWTDNCPAPNYQFQLLRLFNIDESKNTQENISANIDWEKSLTFQTYSSKTTLDLTIGEGQGYYMWRVRPIGTFYENGVGDNRNWGKWNESEITGNVFDSVSDNGSEDVFFFTDVDDQLNYQYSRVFTEGNKVSEQLTYANTLNQVRQSQRYFPSNDGYKVINQTILDKSGRPSLNTMPVPVNNEKINGYKSNLVTTNGELYRAKHFDNITNFENPTIIDATGAFTYYSSLNGDQRISDAEGYSFTRAIFANDGTDRVVNQSGVGKTHMIGKQSEGRGRTTKTLYATPTFNELVALFGDEAPNHQDVAKVISIDPNNTKSVVYITKEGNTIATGLTFSEDSDILDSVKTTNGASVSGKTDLITNNVKTENGFKASKRIAVLEDNTTTNLSYTISKPILEGLCNNLELELDYTIKIQIYDAVTSQLIHEFQEASIASFQTDPNETDITINFGSVTLNTGSYYIQKVLEPAGAVEAKLVKAEDNIKRLIEPYFAWVTKQLDEVDCEEEMQVFYEDLFFYGRTIFNKGLTTNLNFPSGITVVFPRKATVDDEDEFMDFYDARKEQYSITIFHIDQTGKIVPINFATTTELGNIVPVKVDFGTPCCKFSIPIIFTPPFRVPTVEAMEAYVSNGLGTQVNTATDYFWTGTAPTTQINPNNKFLVETDKNFLYDQTDAGVVTIENGTAYPLDFEGYAISMLFECSSSVDPNYTIEDASSTFYNYMRGWHKPGLFNQMVYHMVTDNYGQSGCAISAGGSTPGTPPEDRYHICDIPKADEAINGAAYTTADLAECWEPLVVQLVNELCVEGYDLNTYAEDTVSSNYDQQEADPAHDSHFDDNIKNFILRWISKRKLKRKIRGQRINEKAGPEDEALKQKNNLASLFLDCTGYVFADILNPKDDPANPGELIVKNNFPDYDVDFDGVLGNGEYNNERLLNGGVGENWIYFTLNPATQGNVDYMTPDPPETPHANRTRSILRDLFSNIKDPVYAFKYYEYVTTTFPDLEGQTCYRDPNMCIDDQGNEIACCGTNALGEPIPCNFCGIGYVSCPYTREGWNCDQRFTFFEMIKNYSETPESDGLVVNCENYYEQTQYVNNPDVNKDNDGSTTFVLVLNNPNVNIDIFSDLPYLSKSLVDSYVTSPTWSELVTQYGQPELTNIAGVTAETGISVIENDAYKLAKECDEGCDDRRNEFREKLIKTFTDRCYVIGECKIDTNDNIIPIADIDALVEKMVEQCKLQCTLTTYTCVDDPCRLIGDPKVAQDPNNIYDFNVSYIDYGVSGPIVTGYSTRENQTLIKFDPQTKTFSDTGETVVVSSMTSAGSPFEKYSYTSNPTVWDIRKSLTYAEYSRWIQASEWFINIDLPSKCDVTGNYNESLTYNTEGLPNEPVYVRNLKTGVWEVQNFAICNTPYVTRANPSGPGETFVERDKYIIEKTTPLTPEDDQFKIPVVSPNTGIKYEKNN